MHRLLTVAQVESDRETGLGETVLGEVLGGVGLDGLGSEVVELVEDVVDVALVVGLLFRLGHLPLVVAVLLDLDGLAVLGVGQGDRLHIVLFDLKDVLRGQLFLQVLDVGLFGLEDEVLVLDLRVVTVVVGLLADEQDLGHHDLLLLFLLPFVLVVVVLLLLAFFLLFLDLFLKLDRSLDAGLVEAVGLEILRILFHEDLGLEVGEIPEDVVDLGLVGLTLDGLEQIPLAVVVLVDLTDEGLVLALHGQLLGVALAEFEHKALAEGEVAAVDALHEVLGVHEQHGVLSASSHVVLVAVLLLGADDDRTLALVLFQLHGDLGQGLVKAVLVELAGLVLDKVVDFELTQV